MGSLDHQQRMHIKEIRIYPIKSIRGISLQSHDATAMGFTYDRIFMLQRVEGDEGMHVSSFPSMCLFTTELSPPENPDKILVRFNLNHTFDNPEHKLPEAENTLEIPLKPDVTKLEHRPLTMHSASTTAFVMSPQQCNWFSERFGFAVRLLYIGSNKRPVLGNLNPTAPRDYVGDPDPRKSTASPTGGWLDSVKAGLGSIVSTVATYAGIDAYTGVEDGLTFADCAAFLVVNHRSFLEAQDRVGEAIDVEKFRPNIVIGGAESPWEEDFWGEISIGAEEEHGTRIAFTSNCGRCASLNVDYGTGKPAQGKQGMVFKSLQRDRRVDPGFKYAPVFGRYGFLSLKNGARPLQPILIKVGDEVQITKLNERRTNFYWPDL